MASFAQARRSGQSQFENRADEPDLEQAERVLAGLAGVFSGSSGCDPSSSHHLDQDAHASNLEAKYRALLEQIPAVVFMAYVDRGTSEAYVSPEIEAALGLLPRRVAGRSGPLVRAYSSRGQAALEPRSGGDVSLRQAAPLLVSGDCAGWPGRLVSLRRAHGAPARWPAMVHSWRCVRHLRSETYRARPAAGEKLRCWHSRHRRSPGYRSRPGRTHRTLQSRLRTHHRLLVRRGPRQMHLGVFSPTGGGRSAPAR